jgi:Protein of unknown function (DUF4233)
MRVLCSSVLFFEAILVGLAVPVGRALTDQHPSLILWGGLALACSCLLVAGLLRHRVGYLLGSALQVVVVASGFLLPAMFFLGAVFGALWVLAIVLARRADRYAHLRSTQPSP